MSATENTIKISELNYPEEEQDPRIRRSKEQIEKYKERFEESGWLNPIVFTSDENLIVDGNTRVKALEEIEGFDELHILGEFDGYVFALPDTDLDIDPEEASAELNVYRDNLSNPDRAKFLNYLTISRIIDNEDVYVAGDVNTSSLLNDLENHNREDIDSKWDHSDEAKERLENILDALDFDSPGRARTILNNYQKVSERLLDLWIQGQLSDSHVEQLNNLKDKIVEGVDLEDSETANHSSFEEIVNWSKDENNDQDEYYTRQDLRDINSELDEDAEDEEDLEEKFEILESELDEEDQEQLNEIRERVDDEEQLANSLEDAGDIEEKVDEWDRYTESPEYPLLDERENERKEALEDFDFDDSKAAGEANHLAPPIETDNLGVFFHDCMEMDDEIEDESVQLVFTSPPYFTQRGRIISEWGTGDELTEDNVDTAYENYLDWMIEVIEKCHSKLDVGGHLMLNISDYQPESISKVYDIPSDFSCRIRSQDHLDFEYVSTITWDKGDTETSSRLAQFRKSDNIADFKPAWRTERILVFRKDSPRESRSFTIDRNKLKQYKSGLSPFTDLWKVDATTQKEDAAHEAGFPTTLPYLAVKLFTYPGDTIIDPFGGYATTLVAVRQINKESEEESRKAYAWENFASETESQPDYRQHIKSKVTGIGGKFTEV